MTSVVDNKNILLFHDTKEVSNIYYRDIIIQIHWDNIHQNVLVHHDGMWVVLIDMTIRKVIHSLGFYENDIVVTWARNYNLNILDLLVSKAHQNTIVISQDNPCCIISDNNFSDRDVALYSEKEPKKELEIEKEPKIESESYYCQINEIEEIEEIEELNITQRLSSWVLSICAKKYKFVSTNKFEN